MWLILSIITIVVLLAPGFIESENNFNHFLRTLPHVSFKKSFHMIFLFITQFYKLFRLKFIKGTNLTNKPIIDVPLYSLDNKLTNLNTLVNPERPLVINMGSYT